MRTFHGILDLNNDGVISFEDFKLLTDRFINLGHISEKSAKEFQELIKVSCRDQVFVLQKLQRDFFSHFISMFMKLNF